MYFQFAILLAIILTYSIIAGKVERYPVSAPIIFLTIGLILGPIALHVFNFNFNRENYQLLSEFALALVLFSDASKANLKVLKHHFALPSKLLLIGLPLTILLGYVIARILFPQFSWIEAAILSTILAPTDAALGEPVVSNKSVPSKIREGINVESGLNDGICVPILLLLIAAQKVQHIETSSFSYGLSLFADEIGLGIIVGASIALVGAILIKQGVKNGWIESSWRTTIIILISLSSFTFAQALGGSGFIACFVGGITFNITFNLNKPEFLEGSQGVGKILNAVVWLIFGSVITGWILPQLTLEIILYSLLSLTLIRILPVLLTLFNHKISLYAKLFTAWFGPRGLASIVFAAMVLDVNLPHGNTIVVIALLTILFSVFAHGISANPMAKAFLKSN
ncbi:cation:proton antiporter [Carboxylicivirga sp. A043]|uniref:cation:proton antiporter n=1 Tax=Carboxylicivirga litoralis TaxID=2816963 RepID=UPI0021CB5A05|nr:cation:proton antiporter [Carboxylicivirga sp. A043]MCU4156361.1 cation:proton antiporter [Carboxylicivirga sp. A043]